MKFTCKKDKIKLMSSKLLVISNLIEILGNSYTPTPLIPRPLLINSSGMDSLKNEKRIRLVDEARLMSKYLRDLFGRYEKGREILIDGIKVGDQIKGINSVYNVRKHIASGAMANIHQVEGLQNGKLFALKTLIGKVHGEAVIRRFVREARILASLNHPNIVMLEDLGWHENSIPFIVLELLTDGANTNGLNPRKFNELIVSYHNGEIDLKTILHYYADICDALDYFHNRTGLSVIHRDLKPANILISSEKARYGPERFIIRLADFGLSQLEGGSLTTLTDFQQLIGTPEYAPIPDMLNDDGEYRVDNRSDLYSFGIMLYLLITGKLPFSVNEDGNLESPPVVTGNIETSKIAKDTKRDRDTSKSKLLLLIQKHKEENPLFDTVKEGIPATLIALTQRLLAKHPQDRPQSAKEVSREIRRIADTQIKHQTFPVSLSLFD